MAQAPAQRRKPRDRSREAVRAEYERRRAEKMSKTLKVTPFNPEAFVHIIRKSAWATIHTVAYAAVITVVAILAGRALGNGAVGAFAALLAIGSLYYYLLRVWDIDLGAISSGVAMPMPPSKYGGGGGTSHGRPMSVVGIFITYFITWIMVGFLMSNPPFYDGAPPEVRCCQFSEWSANATWVAVPNNTLNATNGTARAQFAAFDNGQVARVTFEVIDPTAARWAPVEFPVDASGVYNYTFTNASRGSYYLTVNAWDTVDHEASAAMSMNIL